MPNVPATAIPIAFEHCGGAAFEKYSQTVLGAIIGHHFKPLGGIKDGGADGFVDADIYESEKPNVYFQASTELETESKIKKTVIRLRGVNRTPNILIYATSRSVPYLDQVEYRLSEELGLNVRIYDKGYFESKANSSSDVQAAYFSYLQSSILFLEKALAPSFPSAPSLKDAQVISAFLGQEVERRLGQTTALENVTDSLILWALEGTDPEKQIFMSRDEIILKVENVIPTAKRFFRAEIEVRLKHLTKKIDGSRKINIYTSKDKYCLPYESRELLFEHTMEDEALKAAVTSSFQARIFDAAKGEYGTAIVDKLVAVVHATLEVLFSTQGFEMSRHFLEDEKSFKDYVEPRTLLEIADEQLKSASVRGVFAASPIAVVRQVLRGVFYAGNDVERKFCARLARTYMLLFTIRNTPEVINYFNTMSRHMNLYVGSDLLVRAMSEIYLPDENQMTVNALKIIKQAGSKLILTEVMLEEIHSHLYASHLEYQNHYMEVEPIVDEMLASQANKILIRAYYYAKFARNNQKYPKNWDQFVNNFVTPSRLVGSLSSNSMRELRETLCNRYGMDFEERGMEDEWIDQEELNTLAEKIRDMRSGRKREILSANDAYMILRVDALRRKRENRIGNPYGAKTWYLTQDSVSNIATSICFRKRRGVRYVMPPEFLINYIAYNPTSEDVCKSLKNIFPSVLGLRLGVRLEPKVLAKVMESIRSAFEVDEARATSIVAEHADALKSDRMRDFAIKYENRN